MERLKVTMRLCKTFNRRLRKNPKQTEETKSYNIGLDLSLFNNRLEFIIDAYLKKTVDPPLGLMARLSPPAYLAAGAAATGIAWLAVHFVGI